MGKLILEIIAAITSWFQQNQLISAGKTIQKENAREEAQKAFVELKSAVDKLSPAELEQLLDAPADRQPDTVSGNQAPVPKE